MTSRNWSGIIWLDEIIKKNLRPNYLYFLYVFLKKESAFSIQPSVKMHHITNKWSQQKLTILNVWKFQSLYSCLKLPILFPSFGYTNTIKSFKKMLSIFLPKKGKIYSVSLRTYGIFYTRSWIYGAKLLEAVMVENVNSKFCNFLSFLKNHICLKVKTLFQTLYNSMGTVFFVKGLQDLSLYHVWDYR